MTIFEVKKHFEEKGYKTEWQTSYAGNQFLVAYVNEIPILVRRLRPGGETVNYCFSKTKIDQLIYFAKAYKYMIKKDFKGVLEYTDFSMYARCNNIAGCFNEEEYEKIVEMFPDFELGHYEDDRVIQARKELLKSRGVKYIKMLTPRTKNLKI